MIKINKQLKGFSLLGLLFIYNLSFSQINYQHFIFKGQTELQKEKYIDAIRSLNTAIISKNDAFEAYFLRGIAKFSLGDYQGAVNDFTKTVKLHPLYVRAYQYRGISYDRLLDYAHAIRDYNKSLEIDPFNPDIFLARGDTKMHVHDFDGAIDDFSSSINLKNNVASAWLNRGIAKHFKDDNIGALEDINQAIYLDYFNEEAWVKRGMIKYELDSMESAIADYNHAIKLDSKNPYVYFQRALAYLQLKDTANTINDYNKVLEYDENNALTYYNLAIVYGASKKYDEAIEAYNEVTRLNPYNVYTYYNRANLYYLLSNYQDAEQDLTTAIEIFPDFAGAYINRSVIRQTQKNATGAREDQFRAEEIIAAANNDGLDADLLYSRYADSAYFNKIIEFEADFVNGNMQKGRVQFNRTNIVPKSNFYLIYAFNLPDSIYMKYRQYEYFDKKISTFNADNELGIRFVFTTRNWPVTKELALAELQRIDSTILTKGDTAGVYFLKGVVNGMLQNYTTAINAYDMALEYDPKISYALFNRGTLRFEMDEFVYNDQMYTNSITVSRNSFTGKTNERLKPPNHTEVLRDYDKAIASNPELPYIYYNRALTLLYVNETKLACKDLSKAGELGIKESYNIIKRYCNK